MDLNFDQRFLNRVIVVLVAGMLLAGALIGLKAAGFFGSNAGSPPDIPAGNNSPGYAGYSVPAEETPLPGTRETDGRNPAVARDSPNQKTLAFHWMYKNESFDYSRKVSNSTYYSFEMNPAVKPATGGDRLLPYVVTTGDENLVRGIAEYLLKESAAKGWGDYDTIANLAAFLHQFNGASGFRNLPPESAYKYPFQTLYDGSGTRDDVTILGGAVLESMGYPIAFLVYPRQFDRGYYIYEYEGVAVRCDEGVPGRKYAVEHSEYAGTALCSPVTLRYTLPEGSISPPSTGILRGNTTIVYADNQTISAGLAEWDIRSGTMSWTGGFFPPAVRAPDHYRMENASWITNEDFCFIGLSEPGTLPGTIPGELARVTPRIVQTPAGNKSQIRIYRDDRIDATLQPSLRKPSPLNGTINRAANQTDLVFMQSLPAELRIPVPSGEIDDILPENKQRESEYWEDVWYDRSTWYYDQSWYINVLDYSVVENPYLYTRENEIYVSPATAWRIKYSAIPTNPPDKDLPGLSTFSDMRFAVYKIDRENNTAHLFDTFSYGYATGQENIKYRNYYEPGTFYIAVFVRNCMADLSIQMHGKNPV